MPQRSILVSTYKLPEDVRRILQSKQLEEKLKRKAHVSMERTIYSIVREWNEIRLQGRFIAKENLATRSIQQ